MSLRMRARAILIPLFFYAVLGSHTMRQALVPRVNELVTALGVTSTAASESPATRPRWN